MATGGEGEKVGGEVGAAVVSHPGDAHFTHKRLVLSK